jgi:hypothetical protein
MESKPRAEFSHIVKSLKLWLSNQVDSIWFAIVNLKDSSAMDIISFIYIVCCLFVIGYGLINIKADMNYNKIKKS